ncbi:poly-beta-1,6-N-acetyl-D-glucosamine N-deacetylase PgaB [Kosakonia oryzae]|uniref:Biofilm PGA synthesis lipoprotein PgaB n=1 Tax=Kosakonia oryzae TaxID=497725 RepID=A0AA94H0V0_9ENTR|nr:poly-beta-1,6-N-acetyl-D-glucosamine N-deacetylase PgaB [Kosakonia oryzae]ANI83759.1 poly-beta-1,6-N-acetyl-D-glucosamine N-deacetylase PgaB [Kosakonia oryzae]SFB78369.1 biofilm PGA synthesis lipoprotein PgaB [Kosakonia oryzae]
MLNYVLRIILLAAGWLLIAGYSGAETPRFLPPAERPQLEQNKPWPENHFLVLAYHDVEDQVADQRYLSVQTSALNDQMVWLRDNGYQPVSVQQILDAHNGGTPLPPKAVLISFDDGYSSFYTRVWPLLKAYNWPALWAPVGSWVDTPADKKVDFGGLMTERERFATWDMVRELSRSPLVEIGAHTWNSHYGSQANPQGSAEPVVANRLYNKVTGQYETEEQFTRRIDADVSHISASLRDATGKSPRVWVWPYGAANGTTLSIASKHGYQMAFTLNSGLGDVRDLMNIPRVLISLNPDISEFATEITRVQEASYARVMHIDLDYVYDPDPQQLSKNIDKLIQRVSDMKITHVFLQAFADPDGSGTVKALYFQNRWLPVRADLFNFLSWQLQTRAGVKVYAWMPVLSFDLESSLPRVESWDPKTGKTRVEPKQYQRLSPWSPEARKRIIEIYEDLARHAPFTGILFHDDALLSDFEDASPAAMQAYHDAGFSGDIGDIRNNPEEFQRWTRYKSRYLIDFTKQLTQVVRSIRGPQVRTARNIYAMPILQPESEAWYAQNLDDFLSTYDWTAPMAMPLMENIPLHESNAWLDKLVTTVAQHPGALSKTVFELQGLDWRSDSAHAEISGQQMAEWMYQLQKSGAASFGYYPDDFINGKPDISQVRPAFSSYWYPKND